MRSFVLAAPLLLASTTFALSPLRRGLTTDTCANLNAELVFPDILVDDKPYDAGRIHIGLCISQVPNFVGHYNVTEAAAKVVGVNKVESTVIDMIKKAGVQCSYPPHAMPSVTDSSECDFVCTDGFLAMPASHPSSCICPPHLMECDGKCGHYHMDCATTPPPSRRQNNPKCSKDLTMCGVPDATWGQPYKCIDVTSDSYTCGGCVKASPFGSPSTDGVNCHNIPNIDEVSCKDSKCFVHTCKTGFTPSASNDGCVAELRTKITRDLPLPGGNQIMDAATIPINAISPEELSETRGPGSTVGDKVPRTDTTSDATRQIISSGKASLRGAQSSVPGDIHTATKISREFVPLKGQGINVEKAGTRLSGDTDADVNH